MPPNKDHDTGNSDGVATQLTTVQNNVFAGTGRMFPWRRVRVYMDRFLAPEYHSVQPL